MLKLKLKLLVLCHSLLNSKVMGAPLSLHHVHLLSLTEYNQN